MAIYTVHAGHAAAGKKYSGASGILDESTEDRKIKDAVIKYLRQAGHTVYDCTVDSGSSQSNILAQIKKKINSHPGATANISIHLNCATGSAHGVECEVYSLKGTAADMATRINAKEAALGFKNRGNFERTGLAVLKGITNGGANILVETLFCDSQTDAALYKKVGADGMGKAIAEGILGKTISTATDTTTTTKSYYLQYKGTSTSIVDALNSVGCSDVSMTHRKKIAAANGIEEYSGSAVQNMKLLTLLKMGKLVKA